MRPKPKLKYSLLPLCLSAVAAAVVAAATVAPLPAHAAPTAAAVGELALRYADAMERPGSASTCGQSPNRRPVGIFGVLVGGLVLGLPMSIMAKRHTDLVDGWRRCYGAVVELRDGRAELLVDLDSHRHAVRAIEKLGARRVLAVFNDRYYRCGAVAKSNGGRSRIYAGVASTASGAEKEAIKACRYVSGTECRIEVDGSCNAWTR